MDDKHIEERPSPAPAKSGAWTNQITLAFAGAGANVPENVLANPAFFERALLLHVFTETLHRGLRQNKPYFDKHGQFFIAEVGTYRGRGLRMMLEAARRENVRVHITGLDSFEGLPPISEDDAAMAPENAPYLKRVLFADTTEREVRAYVGQEFENQYDLAPGFFSDTLPNLPKRKYLFVLIDCDLYSSHMETMAYFYSRLLPGGVMFFDDYYSDHYPMARIAIDRFMKRKPENLFHLAYGKPGENSFKTYIIKSQE